jgi:hypothetical protein
MGAAQILSIQHCRHILVSGIAGSANNLISAIVPDGPGPYYLVVSGIYQIAVLSHKNLLKRWLRVESRLLTPAVRHMRTVSQPGRTSKLAKPALFHLNASGYAEAMSGT